MDKTFLKIEHPQPTAANQVKEGIISQQECDAVEYFIFPASGSCMPETQENAEKSAAENGGWVELDVPRFEYDTVAYALNGSPFHSKVFMHNTAGLKTVSESVWNFAARYPELSREMRSGNFRTAGIILAKSSKLREFRELIRYSWGGQLIFALAMYWMCEFKSSKDTELTAAMSSNPKAALSAACTLIGESVPAVQDTASDFQQLLTYVKGYHTAEDVAAFRTEVKTKLTSYLTGSTAVSTHESTDAANGQGDSDAASGCLVLPVVGTGYRSCISQLAGYADEISDEIRKREILDGADPLQTRMRVRRWYEKIRITLLPEPSNKYDSTAVQVIMTAPGSSPQCAGYLKRETASVIFPLLTAGIQFTCRLYTLASGSAEIEIRRKA